MLLDARSLPCAPAMAHRSSRPGGPQGFPPLHQLPSLTGLRWVAAFMVFAYHVRNFGYVGGAGGQVVNALFGPGYTGVSFFFVLSGFVLVWSARAGDGPLSFWRRRFARVYPVHLVTAVLALGLAATLVPGLRPHGLPGAVANLLLVSAWKAEWWQALNPVSWSLTCEAFFYACFPALLAVLRRLGSRWLTGLAVAAGTAVVVLAWLDDVHRLGVVLNTFPPVRLPEFMLGATTARLVQASAWRGPGLGGATGVTVAGYVLTTQVAHSYAVAACTLLGFGLLVPAAAQADLTGRASLLRHPLLVRLGEWSFAFYMIHVLVLRVGERLFGADPELPAAQAIVAATTVFAVSLALAWGLFAAVEVPGRRLVLGRRDRGPGQVLRRFAVPAGRRLEGAGRHRRNRNAGQRRGARALIAGLVCTALVAAGTAITPRHLAVGSVGSFASFGSFGSFWSAADEPDRRGPAVTGAVVVLGASVSAGYRTSPGTPWPRLLAERLTAQRSGLHVVNASISATRLLVSAEGLPSALSREDHDALSVPQTRIVILTDLINDIQQPPHQNDPEMIEAGLRQFVASAHARGVRVVATTIPPYGGFVRYEPAGEACRRAVNDFIRSGGTFDAVLDFDAVLADPADPTRMRPDLDSGDHLHPGDTGHRALAGSIDLARLAATATR